MKKKYLLIACIFMISCSTMAQVPIAEGSGKFLGSAHSSSQSKDFALHWNQVTPENGGKWGSVERTRDQMNWTDLDAAYNLARENGFVFKLHVLIWGNQQPSWMKTLPEEEQLEEIEEWFAALAERYPDLEAIEVVNEPLHDPPTNTGNNASDNGSGGYYNALGGAGVSGWDWVLNSFRMAREYFPNAKLMLNDYGILGNTTSINRYLTIVRLLKEEDLIDYVGVQGHAFTVNDMSSASVKSSLDMLAEVDLPLFITELDIDGPTDEIQQERYKEVFTAMWSHESVQGITMWGYRNGMWRSDQMAYLFNPADDSPRPAYTWLRDYVENFGVLSAHSDQHSYVIQNPAVGGWLNLKGFKQEVDVRMIDLQGRTALNQTGLASGKISLSGLNPGLYLLQIKEANRLVTEKLIVK